MRENNVREGLSGKGRAERSRMGCEEGLRQKEVITVTKGFVFQRWSLEFQLAILCRGPGPGVRSSLPSSLPAWVASPHPSLSQSPLYFPRVLSPTSRAHPLL